MSNVVDTLGIGVDSAGCKGGHWCLPGAHLAKSQRNIVERKDGGVPLVVSAVAIKGHDTLYL